MQDYLEIYGTKVKLPHVSTAKYIEDWGTTDPKEQYWRRHELPEFFENVELDKNKEPVFTDQQYEYAMREIDRCLNGFWFYNNGTPIYITGKNYFYIQWWKLEDGIYPDFRDADRRYYLFLNHWENVLWCLGIARGKKRREGASSQATANLIYECIFYKNTNAGLVSKTQTDSRETFLEMVANGYRELPIFLKPRQLNREDSVSELVFSIKDGTSFSRSKVNYRAPVENAYDRGRMSRVLADEGGKWPKDVKFSKFISKLSKTLIKGAKRVGFVEAPSTVNELTKAGGDEFKKFWDGANQFKERNGKTPNRFVTYFSPAYDNYEGFIDRYGYSVIEAPTQEQYDYLVEKWVVKDPTTGETLSEVTEESIRLGSKEYVYSRRKNLSGDLLEEEIRQNPTTVQEMFEAANVDCVFNSVNLNRRKRELEDAPVPLRKIVFVLNAETQKVETRDANETEKGFHWTFTYLPPPEKRNLVFYENGMPYPNNQEDGAIAVDSYSNSQGGMRYGSKACALVGRRADVLDPQNTGRVIGMLYGRPREKDQLHQQVMWCAMYFGYKVWYEHTADDYDGYYKDRGKTGYLGLYPVSLIDPTKRENADRYRGTPITPFSLTKQLDNGTSYIEHHCDRIDFIPIIDNALLFDPYDRTKFDIIVSFLILISVLMEAPKKLPPQRIPLVRIYNKQSYVEG